MNYGIWTDEHVEQVKKLWADGLSAGKIADKMGCFRLYGDGGRSAVMGKIFRLKLNLPPGEARRRISEGAFLRNSRRVSSVARLASSAASLTKSASLAPARASPASSAAPLAPDIPDDERYGPYIQVRHLTDENCHFALGDPREPNFGFCGAPAMPIESEPCGDSEQKRCKPFCRFHCGIVYQPPYCRYRADRELQT
jgi:GcrA cell cycle regulator